MQTEHLNGLSATEARMRLASDGPNELPVERRHGALGLLRDVVLDPSRYTCYGCHEHSGAKVRREYLEEGIRDFQNCVKCHRDPGVEPEKDKGRGRGQRERDWRALSDEISGRHLATREPRTLEDST